MNATRFITLMIAIAGASVAFATGDVRAQQKYTISRPSSTASQYLQQHAIDVGDAPGHQVRVYELRFDYPERDLAFAGVVVKENITRGISGSRNSARPRTSRAA